MINCPNIHTEEYKVIKNKYDDEVAHLLFFRNGDKMPTLEEAKVLLEKPKIEKKRKEETVSLEQELKATISEQEALEKEIEAIVDKSTGKVKEEPKMILTKRFKNPDGTGMLIYKTPGMGGTEAVKLSAELEDFDNLLVEEVKKFIASKEIGLSQEQKKELYPNMKEALTKESHEMGWAIKADDLFPTSNDSKMLYSLAYVETRKLNAQGISVIGGNAFVGKNADTIITYGTNTAKAINDRLNKRDNYSEENVIYLQNQQAIYAKGKPTLTIQPNQFVSDVLFEKESTKPDKAKIKRLMELSKIDIDSGLTKEKETKGCP